MQEILRARSETYRVETGKNDVNHDLNVLSVLYVLWWGRWDLFPALKAMYLHFSSFLRGLSSLFLFQVPFTSIFRKTGSPICFLSKRKRWKSKDRRYAVLAGELGRSKKVCSSMSKVQFYNRTTRQYLLPILRRIDVGDHMAKVGRIVGLKRQHVKYYVGKLERAGLFIV